MSAGIEHHLKEAVKELAEIRRALNRLCKLMDSKPDLEINIPDLETYFEQLEDDCK